jgi:NTP pyrophosphatase (non-canonical NTP hydrolase)
MPLQTGTVKPFGAMTKLSIEVLRECDRQITKWGIQSHSQANWYAILGEEFGEVGKAICEIALSTRGEFTPENLRDELIHVAAVAIAAAESLDRAGFEGG